jgi:hypothetical protein
MSEYKIWRGQDGTLKNISDMSNLYINNCIAHIKSKMNELNIDVDMEKEYGIINRGYDFNEHYLKPYIDKQTLWYIQHGKNYIKAFEEELKIRNSVK